MFDLKKFQERHPCKNRQGNSAVHLFTIDYTTGEPSVFCAKIYYYSQIGEDDSFRVEWFHANGRVAWCASNAEEPNPLDLELIS
jgi:hypothetical protein